MAVMDFWIDIEDASGTKQGGGPITSAAYWRYTGRMDRAGSFEFAMPAADPKARSVQKKYKARAWAILDGALEEVGAGIIDEIEEQPQADGKVILRVRGDGEERELNYRTVGFLELASAGTGVTHSSAVASLEALAPSGWDFAADGAAPNDYVYARFAGESVLQAAIAVAAKSQTHFYRSGPQALTFASSFTSSGVRAVQATGDLSAAQAAIVSLTRRINSYDLLTRIYPFGAGQGRARLTLAATSRAAPAGYTLNAASNYIENDTAETTYGVIEQYVEFKDIAPLSNTDTDLESAADMLFDVAMEELRRRSTELEDATYTLRLAQCSALLRPMQTIRLAYRDAEAGLEIDETLNILEATFEVSPAGLRTTDLIVSSADRWPENDTTALVAQMAQGRVFEAHPQLNANSYVLAFVKNLDTVYDAALRFRLGAEIVTLNQILLEYQVLPFEATVRSIGVESQTGGSGEIISSAPSSNTSGNPSNNTSGAPSNNTSGAPSNNTSGTPSVSNTGAASGNTAAASGSTDVPSINSSGIASGNTGAASGNTGAASGNTGNASGNTGGSGTLETDGPEGGDIDGNGDHQHTFTVTLGGTVTYPIGYGAAGTAGGLVSSLSGSTHDYPVDLRGDHTHGITDHTHTLGSHNHDLGSHNHDLGSHSHNLNNHTHDLNSHTHSLNNHTHDLNSHTHGLNSHTHTLNSHTHDLGNHTHDLGNHTHDLGNHTHTVEPEIATQYGLFRDGDPNMLDVSQLEYRVNGGSWNSLEDDSDDAGDGWYQLDLTALIMDATTFRPNQANNLIEIRGNGEAKTIAQIADVSVAVATQLSSAIDWVAGQYVTISGTTNFNGTYRIDDVNNTTPSAPILTLLPPVAGGPSQELAGTITALQAATLDAQLAVRNVIQAIAYI